MSGVLSIVAFLGGSSVQNLKFGTLSTYDTANLYFLFKEVCKNHHILSRSHGTRVVVPLLDPRRYDAKRAVVSGNVRPPLTETRSSSLQERM